MQIYIGLTKKHLFLLNFNLKVSTQKKKFLLPTKITDRNIIIIKVGL